MKKIVSILSLSAIAFTSVFTMPNVSFAEEMTLGVAEDIVETTTVAKNTVTKENKKIENKNVIGQADGATSIYVKETETPNISVLLNGVAVNFPDQKPVIKNGRTLVPFRAVLEAMGADIEWDNINRTVRASQDGVGMVLEIGNPVALIGFEKVEMDVPAEIINGRTMIPLRFVSEGLGYSVEFNNEDPKNYVINIDKSQEQMAKEKEEREKKNQEQRENIFDQFL